MTCFFRCSSRHIIHTGVSGPKIISLYFVMVYLMTFSSSSFVFIQFRQGIFNFLASSNSDVLFIYYWFCNPQAGYKNLFFLLFTPLKIHHHHSTCYIVSFLHQCIYTLQHIPEDDNVYLVCRQNRSLTLPFHCNTCRMEQLGHENLSLIVLSTFSAYDGRICFLLILLSVFQTAATQPHSKSFYTEAPTHLPQKH